MRPLTTSTLSATATDALGVRCGEELSSPRRTLVDATAMLARGRGRRVTVMQICKQAGIPQDAFHGVFRDAEECFSVTVEDALEQLWSIIELEVDHRGGEWSEQLAVAVATFLAALAADPARAWLCIVEPLEDDGRAAAARSTFRDRLVGLLEADLDGADDGPTSRTIAVGTVGSLWELAYQHVTAPDEDIGIDTIAESVTFLALASRVGRSAAMQHVFSAPKPSELGVVWPARGDDDA